MTMTPTNAASAAAASDPASLSAGRRLARRSCCLRASWARNGGSGASGDYCRYAPFSRLLGRRPPGGRRQPERGSADLLGGGARLTILGAPVDAAVLNGVDVFYRVAVKGQMQWLPHFAWTRSPLSVAHAVVTTPTLSGGLLLSVHHQGTETCLPLSLGTARGAAKLCVGTYVLAAGSPAWGAYVYQPGAGPLDPGHCCGVRCPARFRRTANF